MISSGKKLLLGAFGVLIILLALENMKTKHPYKDLLVQKDYIKVLIASIINRIGDSVDTIALTYLVYRISESAMWSAVVFGINKLPAVVITPIAGVVVERMNKKKVMIVTDFIRACSVGILATAYHISVLNVYVLIVLTLVISIAEAFRIPASYALTPKILEEKNYESGYSLLTGVNTISELVGTASAASVITLLGISGAIYFDMITFIVSAIILMYLRYNYEPKTDLSYKPTHFFVSLKEGLGCIIHNKSIRFIIYEIVFINAILVPINCLQAPMAGELFQSGVEVLSILGSGLALGTLLGAWIYPFIPDKIKQAKIINLCCLTIAGFYISVVLISKYILTKQLLYIIFVTVCICLGFIVSIVNLYISVIAVRQIPEDYLARVGGTATALGDAVIPITSWVIGIISIHFSVSFVYCLSASIAVCVIGILGRICSQTKELNHVQ